MKNKGLLIVIGAVLGFIVGYILFAKIMGSQVSLSAIFDFSGGSIGKFGRSVGGIKAIQQKVFISTGVGAVAGLVYSYLRKK